MSETEILRLAAALREQPALVEACERVTSLAELGDVLKAAGFDISEEEARELFLPPSQISDSQLDAVAGGEDGGIVFMNGWHHRMTHMEWMWRQRIRGDK